MPSSDNASDIDADASTTHLVLIPSYNAGGGLTATVRGARAVWSPVWVVIDGSTDGSERAVMQLAESDAGVRVFVLPRNQGKGAAVLHGLVAAHAAGYTHALTMDSDGQHPADRIADFMHASIATPAAMVLGNPIFDENAPSIRVKGRRISNWWTRFETMRFDRAHRIEDALFGFRVYPIAPLMDIMRKSPWMRRFDFDTEAVVRLAWRGVAPINIDAAVRYFDADEGGVSHFKYGRDNVLLTGMHLRLLCGFVLRLPMLIGRRLRA